MTQLIVGVIVTILGGIAVEYFKTYFIEKKGGEVVPEIQIKQVEVSRTIPVSLSGVTCPKCKSVNNYESRYCINCGSVLYEVCPNCNYVKAVIERRCAKCGKDPTELSWTDYYLDEFKTKAVWLGIASGLLFIRVISLSDVPNWIDGLSIPIAIVASVCIWWESADDLGWLLSSKLRKYRGDWIENSVKNFDLSLWVLAGASISNLVWVVIAITKVFEWIRK